MVSSELDLSGGPVLRAHGGSVADLALLTRLVGDELVGVGEISEHMLVPGRTDLLTSVLVTWADVVAGKFANAKLAPSICMTLDLDLHLLRSPSGAGFEPGDEITSRAHIIRAGRRIVVMGVEFETSDGERFGFATADFIASPDPRHETRDGFPLDSTEPRRHLDRPFAERVGIRRLDDGRVELPNGIDNVNATGGLQGGLLALAAEEAVLATDPGAALMSMSIRYLRAFRNATAIAHAVIDGSVARVGIDDPSRSSTGALVTAHLDESWTRSAVA